MSKKKKKICVVVAGGIINNYLHRFAAHRLVMGACLLRAGEGACVRRLEARLLLPDASLLHERGRTKSGESFNVGAHAQLCVSPQEVEDVNERLRVF